MSALLIFFCLWQTCLSGAGTIPGTISVAGAGCKDRFPSAIVPDSVMALGKTVYDSYCLACHQANGLGIPEMYPPLTDTAWLSDRERLIGIVLDGLSGPVTVNGESYNEMMPTHNFLSDKEVAAVLSYIGKKFGKIDHPFTPAEVTRVRGE